MRCVLTKENVKKLSIDFRPVIKGTQMVGIEANPSRKPYIVYDCHQEAAKGLALYIGVSKATFIVKRRVGQKIVTTKIGELGDFNFNMADESRDARSQAHKISFDIKAGIDRKAVQQAERLVNQATLAGDTSEGKVGLGELGQYLKRTDPAFSPKAYGHSGLLDMVETYTDLSLVKVDGGHWVSIKAKPEVPGAADH